MIDAVYGRRTRAGRAAAAAALLSALLFVSCDDLGVFKSISEEIELYEGEVRGNIYSLAEYNGSLYAGGGFVYRKALRGRLGWAKMGSQPDGMVIGLRADDGSGALLALTVTRESYQVWKLGTGEVWEKDGGASSSRPASFPAEVWCGGEDGVRFSAADSETITYGAYDGGGYGADKKTASASGTVYSLWYFDGYLYAGLSSGLEKRAFRDGALGSAESVPGSNTAAAIGSYTVTAVWAGNLPGAGEGGDTEEFAIYAATIGRGTYQGSKNNCLWGYYRERGNWNKE